MDDVDDDDDVISGSKKIDAETSKRLESFFRRLIWSRDCSTLLKQCLTKSVFDALKTRTTGHGATLLNIIQVELFI